MWAQTVIQESNTFIAVIGAIVLQIISSLIVLSLDNYNTGQLANDNTFIYRNGGKLTSTSAVQIAKLTMKGVNVTERILQTAKV